MKGNNFGRDRDKGRAGENSEKKSARKNRSPSESERSSLNNSAETNPIDPDSGEGYMKSGDADYGRENYGGGAYRMNRGNERGDEQQSHPKSKQDRSTKKR